MFPSTEVHGHVCHGYTDCGSGYPCTDPDCQRPERYTCDDCLAEQAATDGEPPPDADLEQRFDPADDEDTVPDVSRDEP